MAFAALGDSARAWELTAIDQSRQSRADAGGCRDLQGGTLRGRRRRLRTGTAHGAAAVGPGNTGSAGWMYRLVVESLLGLKLESESTPLRAVRASGLE